ncbi:nucleotidyltransferase family protein [Enterobacteriaceae bacterium LUAb1]
MSNNWKKSVLLSHNTLRDALNVINKDGSRIGIIVDCEQKLVGVITDGDIRRALLKNINLDSCVVETMNTTPVVIKKNTSRSETLKIMQEKSIIAIPVVNEDNVLVGLETWNTSSAHRVHDNPVFIMAGGFGTRLKPLTDTCPKPMLKIGGKPILETLLIQFCQAGFNNIYISTHYMPEEITNYFGDGKKWGLDIKYVHESNPLGTGGALGLLPVNDQALPLIVINGDVLTTLNIERLLQFHESHKSCATMCVREYEYQIPYGVITGKEDKVISMVEKPVHKFFVNAGIYVLDPDLYKNVPKDVKIDMPTLLEKEISKGKEVTMFPIHEYWLDIGKMDDFNKAKIDITKLNLL